MDNLERMSNKLFGTPIVTNKKSEASSEENFVDPNNVKTIDSDKSIEDK